jgi:mannitol/fructose-specific phosphotransferase system IIA component (Ntr-type)
MKLDNFFKKSEVILLENNEKKMAIREMISKMEELGKIKSTPRYYAQVIHRESLENTGIGKGLAIPHARTESLTEFNALLGICPQEIDYQAYDDKPVKFILLCLFPTSVSTKYLYLISMISKIFSDEENVKKISKLENPEDVYDFLDDVYNNYLESNESFEQESNDSLNLSGVPTSDLDLLIRIDRLYKFYDENKSESTKQKLDELKKLIDNRSLSYYEKMRKKCKTPFAIVEKEACSGCNMNIPPIEMNEIKEKNTISVCSYCGRFLILI